MQDYEDAYAKLVIIFRRCNLKLSKSMFGEEGMRRGHLFVVRGEEISCDVHKTPRYLLAPRNLCMALVNLEE